MVTYCSPTLKISASLDSENEASSFICIAEDFSPKDHQIKWLKNEQEITGKISEYKTSTVEKKFPNGTKYSVASILTLKSTDVPELTRITCEFKRKIATGYEFTNESLIIKPQGPCRK